MATKPKKIPDAERFGRILTDKGFKVTPQRMAVHNAMRELVHARADQVFELIMKNEGKGITQMSVYNTLSQMADAGIYARRLSSGSTMTFDVDPKPHPHLYDTVRGEFRDIDNEDVVRKVEEHFRGRRWKGYHLEGYDIQLLCRPTGKSGKR